MVGLVSLIGASWGSPEKAAIEALVLDVAQRGRAICGRDHRNTGDRSLAMAAADSRRSPR